MAKANTSEEQVIEAEEAPKGVAPKVLAADLDVDPKTLRGYLRKEFPRDPSEKNTSWLLTEEMVAKATAHFSATDGDEDSSEEDSEDETADDES